MLPQVFLFALPTSLEHQPCSPPPCRAGLAPPAGLARGLAQQAAHRQSIKEGKKYDMTGQTGALTYMAPEVLLGSKYNEKVDVFRWVGWCRGCSEVLLLS